MSKLFQTKLQLLFNGQQQFPDIYEARHINCNCRDLFDPAGMSLKLEHSQFMNRLTTLGHTLLLNLI